MSKIENQDFFNSIDDQEIRSIVQLQGVYARGGVEDWERLSKETGEIEASGTTGWIQFLQIAREDSKKLKITSIRVDKDDWHMIDVLNKKVQLKPLTLQVEMREYGKNYSYVLIREQPHLNMADDTKKAS